MIKGRCFTNLDGFGYADWPELFVAVPRVGEWVESGYKRLRVVSVTHSIRNNEPFITVELHK